MAGCDSRVIGISRVRWSVGFGGLACRSRTLPVSLRIPRFLTRAGRPPALPARPSILEISLTAGLDPESVRARLDAALPDGIDVIEVADLAAAQAPRLEASEWEVVLPGVAQDDAARAVEAFLAAAHAEVDRLTSKGVRRLDTRAGVVSLELDRRATAEDQPGCAILRMVVRHMTPAVRPEDILAAFRTMSALEPSSPAVVTRLAQGPLGIDTAAVGLTEAANHGGSAPARRAGRCTGTGNGNAPGCGERQHGEYRSSERVRTAPAWRGAAR